jgi:PTH1 family peptidyl-tRNA hydrolase
VKSEVVNFVLKAPTRSEAALIEAAIDRSFAVLPHIEAGDFPAAMKQLHTKERIS